jgi:hypothetical protein
MELALAPPVEPAVVEAARRAAAAAGALPGTPGERGLWWRAGIGEAVAARGVTPARALYVAAPSPRSTRGATRA